MNGDENAALFRIDLGHRFAQPFDLKPALKIFLRQTWRPKQVDHGAREMTIRLRSDLFALFRRECVAENDLEIATRNFTSREIESSD